MLEGRTDEQKEALIGALHQACLSSIGARPETVTVIVTDVPSQHWGLMGQSIKKTRGGT
jgi:4-oxalocrotonate tautomerase